MKIAGVTVLYNPNKDVIENIKNYLPFIEKLYLVDNSPNKDNKKLIIDKKIEYINNHKNLGIAKALNIGAQKAIKDKYDWLLTMDQDSSFEKEALSKMIAFLKKLEKSKRISKDVGVPLNKIGLISPFHVIPQKENLNPSGIEKPEVVMTSGNIVNLKVYQEVEGFKDWLFIDAVDFDFCLNLRMHGYKVIQINEARLKHNLGKTEKKKFLGKECYTSNHDATRRYYIVRNRHYIYDMYKNDFPDFCNAEVKMTKREVEKVLLFEKNKIAKIKAMYKGYKDYKKGRKGEKNEKI